MSDQGNLLKSPTACCHPAPDGSRQLLDKENAPMPGSFRWGEYSKMGYCVNPIYSFITMWCDWSLTLFILETPPI